MGAQHHLEPQYKRTQLPLLAITGPGTCMWYTDIHTGKTTIHIRKYFKLATIHYMFWLVNDLLLTTNVILQTEFAPPMNLHTQSLGQVWLVFYNSFYELARSTEHPLPQQLLAFIDHCILNPQNTLYKLTKSSTWSHFFTNTLLKQRTWKQLNKLNGGHSPKMLVLTD